MGDSIVSHLRASLSTQALSAVEAHLRQLEVGDYEGLLKTAEAEQLFGHRQHAKLDQSIFEASTPWNDYIFQRLNTILADRSQLEGPAFYLCIAYASLLAFIQTSVTGPPLEFDVASTLFPDAVAADRVRRREIHDQLIDGLSVDGIAAYRLVPNIELLVLADTILTSPAIVKGLPIARWVKLRAQFMHQRLLPETSTTLQELIYDELDFVQEYLTKNVRKAYPEFLLERASIHLHHSHDKFAQADIESARIERHFNYALTGFLGKRTKFQDKDISQLVVLAKSHDSQDVSPVSSDEQSQSSVRTKPAQLDLNDDTLLESITFSERPDTNNVGHIATDDKLPAELQDLDPSAQPQLQPLDSTLLLLLASSITNTSPQHGLTREETLPYATRVLEGGSSNWQIYTQALLVRSRIEGHKARTVERGLLQLQALVDQVIADTNSDSLNKTEQTSTFLPKPKASESAPASERLRYIFQLATPTRWDLEVELASRWVSLGGLRSALDIYERLEMWAEAALCWAATEREDKAKKVLRRQLFHATKGGPSIAETSITDDEEWLGPARDPPPADAPRLYCILGDIDSSIPMYKQAWLVSKERYARAQRSLGRLYMNQRDFVHAAEAYSKSLRINQLNHASWFALGCALLELAQYDKAVQAFSRCVQLDETDAEAWSNLGAAILRTEDDENTSTNPTPVPTTAILSDEDPTIPPSSQSQVSAANTRQEALRALKRAAALSHDSHRIWSNVLTVAASLRPEPEWSTVLTAQKRILELRGGTDGEGCVDVPILERLVAHVIASSSSSAAVAGSEGGGYDASKPGLARLTVRFVEDNVVPVITASARLWLLVGKVALWRNRPGGALDAEEKAWRVVVGQPGWEDGSVTDADGRWREVVEATVRLCEAYENLGPRMRTEGMGAGEVVVMKDWKFKARSAVRGIMSRGKESWEDADGWERLKEVLDSLR